MGDEDPSTVPVRIGSLVSSNGTAFQLALPGGNDPYVDGLAAGRPTAESLRTLELIASPHDRFLDVGANVGEYSIALSPLVAEVLAVEASATNASFLRANIALNRLDNVQVVEAAISSFAARGGVSLSGSSAYVVVSDGENGTVRTVPAGQLLAEFVPTIVKVDIEGYEAHIRYALCDFVHGAGPAWLVVEINLGAHFRASSIDVLTALRTLGRAIWVLYPELPAHRLVPLGDALPARVVSDVLVTNQALPDYFVCGPLDDNEARNIYAGP